VSTPSKDETGVPSPESHPSRAAGRRCHRPLRRPAAVIVLLVLAVCAGASSARPAAPAATFRDVVLQGTGTFALQKAAAAWGGTYTAASGERVRVLVSDGYPQDESRPQAWADLLGSLVHGSELSRLTLYVAPYREIQRICGRGALACYDAGRETIYAPGEQVSSAITAQSVVMHEYGHHLATNRSNIPWVSLNYGPKRWSTYANVCARTQNGELHPGDEMESYELNPGEAFAEAYRVLNERRLGLPESAWNIVDQRFYPDEQALASIEQDVTQPWQPSGVTARGRAAARTNRTVAIATPLDGRIALTVRTSAAARIQLVVDGRVVASKTSRTAGFTATVCGTRDAEIRIRPNTKAATYTLTGTRP
jgi:hypothetical protein